MSVAAASAVPEQDRPFQGPPNEVPSPADTTSATLRAGAVLRDLGLDSSQFSFDIAQADTERTVIRALNKSTDTLCIVVESGDMSPTTCGKASTIGTQPVILFWFSRPEDPVSVAGLVGETAVQVLVPGQAVKVMNGSFTAAFDSLDWTVKVEDVRGRQVVVDRTPSDVQAIRSSGPDGGSVGGD